jgi:membrane-bound inhibitor of C-type lysozyme
MMIYRIDTEDIEHQCEDENLTTIENNPNKKTKE